MQLRHIILGIRRDRGDDDVRDARCSAEGCYHLVGALNTLTAFGYLL